jgi:hypothetical protein
MVKVLVGGGKGKIPIGPVYFTRDYILPGWFRNKTYPQGRASFYVNIHFSAKSRTWTSAYRTVSSYLKCPSITSGPSDAATISLRLDTRYRQRSSIGDQPRAQHQGGRGGLIRRI